VRQEYALLVIHAAAVYNDRSVEYADDVVAEDLCVCKRTAQRYIAAARREGLLTWKRPTHTVRELIHGTVHGYDRHSCRCRACRYAHAKHQSKMRENRYARRDTAVFKHGANGYSNWGCRCDVCREGHHKQMLRDYENRKARR
jgi:hypothetical protein